MVSWKTIPDCCLLVLTVIVLGNYLVQRTEYMESYFDYKMSLCFTDAEKIEQLEKWDANHKFDIPPFRSREEWNTFWFMFRDNAYQRYQHIFSKGYIPPHLREKRIMLTNGGNFMTLGGI